MYDYTLYSSYSRDPAFQQLQAAFGRAFGPSFPTFSYEEYRKGGDYAQRIHAQANGHSERQAVVDALVTFFTVRLLRAVPEGPVMPVAAPLGASVAQGVSVGGGAGWLWLAALGLLLLW